MSDFLLSAARFKYLAAGVELDESIIDMNKDAKFIVAKLSLPVGSKSLLCHFHFLIHIVISCVQRQQRRMFRMPHI